MATVPNQELLSDERIPTVTLDGKRWPIPKLAFKQLEIITPLIMKRSSKFANKTAVEIGAESMSEEGMKEMFTILFLGLQRGHKGLTREEFDEMSIDMKELTDAVATISTQAFAYRPIKPGELPAPMGEAVAGNSQIGTA